MKRMRKISLFYTIIGIIGLSCISTIWSFSAGAMELYASFIEYTISIMSLAGAAIGIGLVITQMVQARELQEAEFIVHLNQSFVDNASYARMYVELEKSMQEDREPDISRIEISNYLTFFETMYILLEHKAIKMKTLDDLFGYRFFIAVHNSTVQEMKLVNQPYNFRNIYYLEELWMQFRKNNGRPIHGEENSLYHACVKKGKEQIYKDIMSSTERKLDEKNIK